MLPKIQNRSSKARFAAWAAAAVALMATIGAPTVAQAAPPAPEEDIYITLEGHGHLAPFYELMVTWSNSKTTWKKWSIAYPGPDGHSYRMYRNKTTGHCLDLKGSAATAGTELTTSPCEASKDSQWWSDGGGTLTPWNAATSYSGLVATFHAPGGWNWNRLVLAPRVGAHGSPAQRPFRIWTQVVPH